jgi:hypothetical protein
MSNPFREREITDGINSTYILKKADIEEIFKFGEAPYIICGTTGSGKSTLALDLIHHFSFDSSRVYYITATEDNPFETTASEPVPIFFRRKPSFETISNIWTEINNENKARKSSREEYHAIVNKLYGKEKAENILSSLYEKTLNYKNERDRKYFEIECLCRLIVFKCKDETAFNMLNEVEMRIVCAMISPPSKTLLILDDVTKDLDTARIDKTKIYWEGKQLFKSEAYKALINDILSTGRHHNAIICLFIHSIEIVNSKDYISNLIILDPVVQEKITNARTFPRELKDRIKLFSKHVFVPEFKYHFLYCNAVKQNYLVGKAEINNEKIKINSMAEKAINLFNKAKGGYQIADINEDKMEEEESVT